MKILLNGLKTNTIEQQGSFESTACLKVLVLSVMDGQIPMAMGHSAFTLLERCILLHLQINAQLWCQKNMKGPHLYNLSSVSM